MPRSLAANQPLPLEKLFQNIAVAHFGARKLNASGAQCFFHGQVAHHRADHTAKRQTLRRMGFGNHINQFVAVIHHAVFIDHHQSVAVAVQRDSVIGIVLQHGSLQGFGIGCADFVVDIVSVRFAADGDDLRAQLVKHFRRRVVACAVGGIDHQFQAAQIHVGGERGFAEFDIAVVRAADAFGASQLARRQRLHFLVQLGFNRQLHFVAQFHAAFGKKFDAVIGKCVVRCGNHHTAVQTQGAGQIGNARRGQRPGLHHAHTGRREAGHQRGFQHIARNARVFADNHGRRVTGICLDQRTAESAAQFHHEIGRDGELAHLAANTVCAEIFSCHALRSLLLCDNGNNGDIVKKSGVLRHIPAGDFTVFYICRRACIHQPKVAHTIMPPNPACGDKWKICHSSPLCR